MIKYILVGLAVLTAVLTSTAGAFAAPRTPTIQPGLFAGTFRGTVHSDDGSSAPLELKVTQHGRDLSGIATLGNGLSVDGGFCGSSAIPPTTRQVTGRTQANDPRRISVSSQFDVQGIPVTVALNGNLSLDGKSAQAQAKVDIPFFCGHDPTLSGTLYRVS
jgi:hypothetical protein